MGIKLLSALFLVSSTVFSADCLKVDSGHFLDDLNIALVDDRDIVTEDDIKYCPGQALKNADLTPESLPDNGSVWRVGNKRWNESWEKEYQNWVKDNVDADFFERINFPIDCADAAIAIRSIFAKIHNLPASFNGNDYKNTSKKYAAKKTVLHWSKENWREDFKNDVRFKEALGEWLYGTGTVNLHKDTYQTAVWDAESGKATSCIAPGTVVLGTGHVEMITFKEGSLLPYRLSSSTMPAKVRPLEENIFSFDYRHHKEGSDHIKKSRGYVLWNWPINCRGRFVKVKDEQMPHYSTEQYLANTQETPSIYYDLNKEYQKSLGLSDEELKEGLKKEFYSLVSEVDGAIEQRKLVVEEGQIACKLNGIAGPKDCFYPVAKKSFMGKTYTFKILDNGLIKFPKFDEDIDESCENCPPPLAEHLKAENIVESSGFDEFFKPKSKKLGDFYYEHSTPSRDERLLKKLYAVNSLLYEIDYSDQEEAKLYLLDKKVELKNGKSISLYHLKSMYHLSPQPWDSDDLRWGSAEMNEVKHYFYHDNKENLAKYKTLLEERKKNPTEENIKKLSSFENDNKVLIKEKNVIDEFFSK